MKRPDKIGNRIKPVFLLSAQTPTYPSGHTTQYWYLYLVIIRDKNINLMELAKKGSYSRIIAEVHFPIDEVAGKFLAEFIYARV